MVERKQKMAESKQHRPQPIPRRARLHLLHKPIQFSRESQSLQANIRARQQNSRAYPGEALKAKGNQCSFESVKENKIPE